MTLQLFFGLHTGARPLVLIPKTKDSFEMAVPRSKVSRQKRNQRRAHDSLSIPRVIEDSESGEYRRSHHIDLKTGMYRGREVLVQKLETDDEDD